MSSMAQKVLESTTNIDKVHKVAVSLSGGMDSSVLLYLMVKKFGKDNVKALTFYYKQKFSMMEIESARGLCKELGVEQTLVDISFLGKFAEGVSSLVEGKLSTPNVRDIIGDPQPTTYLPNRNMVLASIVAAYAETADADGIALGITSVDAYAYWDCTRDFYNAIENVLSLNRKNQIHFLPSLIELKKEEIILLGVELGVPFNRTWTCYDNKSPEHDGLIKPCGVCSACAARREGFAKAGVVDTLNQFDFEGCVTNA